MADVVRANLQVTGFSDQAKVHPISVESAIARLEGPYTLVLADPPYADGQASATLERLARSALVSDDAVVVYEHAARDEPREALGPLVLLKQLRHGDSVLSIYSSAG
jgi:16S rRNA (guanine966-N2)-methyltransferase